MAHLLDFRNAAWKDILSELKVASLAWTEEGESASKRPKTNHQQRILAHFHPASCQRFEAKFKQPLSQTVVDLSEPSPVLSEAVKNLSNRFTDSERPSPPDLGGPDHNPTLPSLTTIVTVPATQTTALRQLGPINSLITPTEQRSATTGRPEVSARFVRLDNPPNLSIFYSRSGGKSLITTLPCWGLFSTVLLSQGQTMSSNRRLGVAVNTFRNQATVSVVDIPSHVLKFTN
jgi:hypothetical protein